MKIIVDFCIVPIGSGASISSYVAACERILREAGLKTMIHALGTNIEGEWDAVFHAIRRSVEVVHEMGASRVMTTIRVNTRTDREQSLDEKIASVTQKLTGPH